MTDQEEPFGPAAGGPGRARRLGKALLEPFVALLFPDRGVPPLVSTGRFHLSMAIVVLAAILAAAAAGARLDVAPDVRAENSGAPPPGAATGPEAEPAEIKTDREIDEEIAKRTAVIRVKMGLGAVLLTPALIVLLAIGLALLGRFVGGKPTFRRALAAASVGMLPSAVKSIVAAAAALSQDAITPANIDGLVSGSLLLSQDNPVLAKAVAGLFFAVWSLVLCGFGLAAASGISRTRAFIALVLGTILLFLLFLPMGAR